MKNKQLLIIKACRPDQWTKNLLVFSAPLFAFQFANYQLWIKSLYAFLSFCLISSAVYLINDVVDSEADKKHPVKKFRPIASGLLSKKYALIFSFVLICISFLIAKSIQILFIGLIAIYLIIQTIYSLKLKNQPLLDLQCIASGFLLRAISGGIAADLELSPWFLLSVWLISLFLAVEKRKAELKLFNNKNYMSRKVLRRYSLELLSRIETLVLNSAFITYSLWSAGPILNGAKTSWMLATIPFVLTGILRYQLISDEFNSTKYNQENINRSPERPERLIFYDKGIRYILLFWFLEVLIIGFFSK